MANNMIQSFSDLPPLSSLLRETTSLKENIKRLGPDLKMELPNLDNLRQLKSQLPSSFVPTPVPLLFLLPILLLLQLLSYLIPFLFQLVPTLSSLLLLQLYF